MRSKGNNHSRKRLRGLSSLDEQTLEIDLFVRRYHRSRMQLLQFVHESVKVHYFPWIGYFTGR